VADVVRGVVVTVVLAVLAGVAASTADGRSARIHSTKATLPLRTAVFDPFTFNGSQYATGFRLARRAGAAYVRIAVPWNEVAPARPAAPSDASDPNWTGYKWTWIDSKVTAAEAAGLTPYLQIGSTPGWAAANRNSTSPRIALLGQFAKALVLHYDGDHGVPAVHVFQVWNEPNLSQDLSPVRAATYRSMVNVVAKAVHAVGAANLVVAGGLDPFGNKAKTWHSVSPLSYMRSLLCLSKGSHPHRTCKARVHFDVWSHHPYTFNGPFGHATRADDVSLGDLPKMRALLRKALKLHRIVSTHGVQFWVTEFSWDTKPPRRHAAPVRLAARWTAEALHQMWRSGVSLVTWFGLQDKGGKSPYQSGLFFHAKSLAHARPKPVRTAFRFPFVAYLGRHTVSVWGRDATSDKRLVTIQRRSGSRGHWRRVARIRSNRVGIFQGKLRLAATKKDQLRALAPGSGKSLAFSLTRPSRKLRYGPWGN
jgi:Cellulase (glycosyl hydrolase family 5)